MAGETCVDFDFSDILSKIEDPPITTNKNSRKNGFLKPARYFVLETNDDFNLSFEKDCSDEDLTVLLDSHQSYNQESSGLISLAALAKDHFSNTLSSSLTNNSGEDALDSFLSSLEKDCPDESESVNCLQDILLGGNCEEQGKNANLCDVFNFLDLKSTPDVNIENVQKEEFVSKEDTFDNEFIQDIDLSFCIKKNKDKAEFSPGSLSLDSKDSGFGDFYSSLSQCCSNSSDEPTTCENLKGNNRAKFTLTRAKQSLLSRSIAAKPQIEISRRKKLNMIKRELLKKNISLPFSKQEKEQKMNKFLSVVDQSNQAVMTSSFLTIPDSK